MRHPVKPHKLRHKSPVYHIASGTTVGWKLEVCEPAYTGGKNYGISFEEVKSYSFGEIIPNCHCSEFWWLYYGNKLQVELQIKQIMQLIRFEEITIPQRKTQMKISAFTAIRNFLFMIRITDF
ncbi:2627_t:CDS:2 [Acaulospora morrowiae]|uniref:2627_t:CDS:1 n=1 Tax=Acaulospora morrowiae TaxID=94023 RepID=A0A9N9H2N9_9GLOM|nr:2627_t:CDS:2 [Acaulospora morrowiae]